MEQQRKRIFGFQKSQDEEVNFMVALRDGKPFVDIRIFHIQEDGFKLWTNKGMFLDADRLSDLKEGVDRLIQSVQSKKI
jgi:hypothetical protein